MGLDAPNYPIGKEAMAMNCITMDHVLAFILGMATGRVLILLLTLLAKRLLR